MQVQSNLLKAILADEKFIVLIAPKNLCVWNKEDPKNIYLMKNVNLETSTTLKNIQVLFHFP